MIATGAKKDPFAAVFGGQRGATVGQELVPAFKAPPPRCVLPRSLACCLPHPTILDTICMCAPQRNHKHRLPAPVPTQPLPLHYRSPPQPIHPTPLNHSADRLPSAPAPLVPHPYPVHGLPEGSNFTRSDVAQQIRRSFDALVKASPIGTPMVGRRLCARMKGCPMAGVCPWSPCD